VKSSHVHCSRHAHTSGHSTGTYSTVYWHGQSKIASLDSLGEGYGCNICCPPAQHTHFACACGPRPHLITNSSNKPFSRQAQLDAPDAPSSDGNQCGIGRRRVVLGQARDSANKSGSGRGVGAAYLVRNLHGSRVNGVQVARCSSASISVQPASNTMQGPRHNLQFRCWHVHDGSLYMYRYQQLVVSNVAVVMVGLFVYRHADCMYMSVCLFTVMLIACTCTCTFLIVGVSYA
jgi:hypothetical protein